MDSTDGGLIKAEASCRRSRGAAEYQASISPNSNAPEFQTSKSQKSSGGEHPFGKLHRDDTIGAIHGNGMHKVMQWISVPVGEEALELDDTKVVQRHGVPKDVIHRFVKQELKQEFACRSLPLAVSLLLVYAYCMVHHLHNDIIGDVQNAIETDLHENAVFAYSEPRYMAHKDLFDVHNAQDLYSWLRVGLRPLLFKRFRVWSEWYQSKNKWPEMEISTEEKQMYLQHNRVIGGVQLTQLRGETGSCPNSEVADVLKLSCIPAEGVLDLDLNVPPEPMAVKMAEMPWDPNYNRFFLWTDDPDDVEIRLRQLEVSNWINNATITVGVHFMTYNAHFDTLTLTTTHFFFSRSGKLWKLIESSTFVLDQYSSIWVLLCDLLFAGMILVLFLTEAKEIVSVCKERKASAAVREYFDAWNVVDWFSIFSGSLLIGLWLHHVGDSRYIKNTLIEVCGVSANLVGVPALEQIKFEDMMMRFFAKMMEVQKYSRHLQIFSSLFPVVLVMRLFKAFNAQPRLALVTQTMYTASLDLLHFGTVFLASFVSFTIMANTLFGQSQLEFRTFDRSFSTCFAVLMGDFDLAAMKNSGRALALFWFITFQVSMSLILLNMLLAIVMDIYTDVKNHVQKTEGLGTQLRSMWRRWREKKAGRRVSLMLVEFSLSRCDGNDEIWKVESFMASVPGLKEAQANRLMLGAVRYHRFNCDMAGGHGMGLSDAIRAIGQIHRQVDSIWGFIHEGKRLDKAHKEKEKEKLAKMIEREKSGVIQNETEARHHHHHHHHHHKTETPALKDVEHGANQVAEKAISSDGNEFRKLAQDILHRLESSERSVELMRNDHNSKMEKLEQLMEISLHRMDRLERLVAISDQGVPSERNRLKDNEYLLHQL